MPSDRDENGQFSGKVSLNFDNGVLICASGLVACLALLSRSVPVLIGAMVMAPVFSPLLAIPFGIFNRDWAMLWRGVWVTAALFAMSFVVCYATAWAVVRFDPIPEDLAIAGPDMISERLTVGWHNVATALAAGAAGALAAAAGRRESLLGVVIAIALVPALAAAAIGFQEPDLDEWGGLQLFAINVVSIVAAGVVTLYVRSLMRRGEREEPEEL